MSSADHGLGGRTPLLAPGELDDEQKRVYATIDEKMVPWAENSGFKAKLSDGKLIGPFNPILLSPTMGNVFLALQEAESKSTTLSERVREVIILTVGAVWQAEYELYAHAAVARGLGFSSSTIDALSKGRPDEALRPEEQTAQRFALKLTKQHSVDSETFEEARAVFKDRGIVEIVILAGCYDLVSSLLNAFEIPVPEQAGEGPRVIGEHNTQDDVTSSSVGGVTSHNQAPQAQLTTVAEFPQNYFLESIAVRADGSVLVTAVNHKELWYVPPPSAKGPVQPLRIQTFDLPTLGLAEVGPDVFLMLAGNIYTTHESFIYKLDLRDWRPGSPLQIEKFFEFPKEARGLNGCCLLAPGVLLVADCFASLIWRIDFALDSSARSARVWMQHESMGYFTGKMKPEQPGVNAVRFAERTSFLYYTSTAKKLLMRVKVDPATLMPAGEPELVVAGRMGDDFCIDEDANVIYLATHRQNTIDVISMDPGVNSGFTQTVAGEPFTEALIGPSGGVWGRGPGDYGRKAFFIMDGGTASPAPGGPRPAKLLQVDLQPIITFPGSQPP